MDLVGHFERYLSDDDLVWECAVCMSPKVPFVTLAPCGHSVCRDCSTAVTTCPLCRAPIQSRVESQELTQQALSRIIYRCPKDLCGFRGNEVEARNHVCRVYRFRAIGPNIPDDEFTTLIKQLPTSATDDEVVTAILEAERRREAPKPPVDNNIPAPTVVVQPSSPLQAVTSPAQPRAPATLYWDYDNLLPHFLGTTTVAFFTNMKDALSSKGVFVRDSFAYLVAGKDYQKDPDKLKDLQVAMRLSGTKREQADRDMSQDMRKRARELQEYGRRGVFVIVSSDKDFTADVKELSEHHDVWVVHNAVQGSDHEKTLKVYATGVLHVSSFLRAVTPPRYRGMLRTVSEEQVATVHRSQRSPARSPARSPQARPATLSPQARPVAALPAATEQTQAATVKVGEVSVPVSYLLRNAGLDRLTNVAGGAAPPGRWCNNHDPHNAATCNYIHIATGYIVVEYVARPVTDFVQNAAVTFLQTQACRQGKWCRNESPHDPTNCHFLHPAPGVSHPLGLRVERVDAPASPHAAAAPLATTSAASPTAGSVLVDGKATPVEQLVPNRALEFLLAHPNCNGRTCNNTTPHHDPSTCSYVHHKQVTTVTIEGRAVDRSRLIGNAALKYLTEHPNAQGKWCTNKRPHDALACTYCHENGL